MKKQILFICIFNVKRSVIAEHFFRKSLFDRGMAHVDALEVFSAGFLGEETSMWFKQNGIPFPDPLFGRASSDFIRSVMSERGVDLSSHRSRSATQGILDCADVIIPLLDIIKRDLVVAFPEYEGKIVLPKELIAKEKGFFWEDTSNVPNDKRMYEFAHNDPHYVNTVINEIEAFVNDAYGAITKLVLP